MKKGHLLNKLCRTSKKRGDGLSEKRHSSLINALRILKSFSVDNPEQGITEISLKLGLGKSTVHRLMATMASEGLVYKDPQSNRYSLGTSVLSLTNIVNSQLPILRESWPVLNVLTETTGENSYIGILEGSHIIYLQKMESDYSTNVYPYVGQRDPIHCTSIGQVILAFQSEETISSIVPEKLEVYTQKTITSRDKLLEKLRGIKNRKYVVSDQEYQEGIVSVGAPIFNEKGQVIAAVSIEGQVNRVREKAYQPSFCREIIKAGERISHLIELRKKGRSTIEAR